MKRGAAMGLAETMKEGERPFCTLDEREYEGALIALGAEPDPDVPHAWWYNGHCFLVTKTGIEEL